MFLLHSDIIICLTLKKAYKSHYLKIICGSEDNFIVSAGRQPFSRYIDASTQNRYYWVWTLLHFADTPAIQGHWGIYMETPLGLDKKRGYLMHPPNRIHHVFATNRLVQDTIWGIIGLYISYG